MNGVERCLYVIDHALDDTPMTPEEFALYELARQMPVSVIKTKRIPEWQASPGTATSG
jgi:hypothetical protein